MPMETHLYPSNWRDLALAIKEKAKWTCQGCQRICRKPGETQAEFWVRLGKTDDKIGRYTLTVAHLNHAPDDCSPDNLKALCSACHCRYDMKQIQRKKYLKRERYGQLKLPIEFGV